MFANLTKYKGVNVILLHRNIVCVCVCVCVCMWFRYTLRYGDKMSPQRWQYPKSLSVWGHFLVPMRKPAYKSD